MKKNKVVALLGLLSVFLSSGLKSSGMENNNLGNPNGGNNSSFLSNVFKYLPISMIVDSCVQLLGYKNEEIGYKDVDYSNPTYKQRFYYQTPYGSLLILTPGDQNWIDRNVLLLDQEKDTSYCWHNASMNYIFAPEFMNMTGLPKKIKIMTDWGKEQLKNERNRTNSFNTRLAGAVKVPREVRQLPDGLENWLDGSDNIEANRGKPFVFNNSAEMGSHTGNNEIKFNGMNIRDVFTNIQSERCSDVGVAFGEDEARILMNRVENFERGFTFSFMYPKVDLDQYGMNVLWFRPQGYFPTCVVVNQFGGGHYTVFYFVYNKDKTVKFCVYLDGNDGNYNGITKGIKIMTYNEAVGKIRELTIPRHNAEVGAMGGILQGAYHVRYSTGDIVEKYYTPKD